MYTYILLDSENVYSINIRLEKMPNMYQSMVGLSYEQFSVLYVDVEHELLTTSLRDEKIKRPEVSGRYRRMDGKEQLAVFLHHMRRYPEIVEDQFLLGINS